MVMKQKYDAATDILKNVSSFITITKNDDPKLDFKRCIYCARLTETPIFDKNKKYCSDQCLIADSVKRKKKE